jgi:hypothetical protein
MQYLLVVKEPVANPVLRQVQTKQEQLGCQQTVPVPRYFNVNI